MAAVGLQRPAQPAGAQQHANGSISVRPAIVPAPTMAPTVHGRFSEGEEGPFRDLSRTIEFYGRVTKIYGSYKVTQLRALAMRLQGASPQQIKAQLWDQQHTWAGQQMYELAISLRGFYLKAGQFIGARADFVPEQICERLCLLQDRVPPMPPAQAARLIAKELGVSNLDEVFQWIDLEDPLGSASISQVHKAQLRQFSRHQLRQFTRRERGLTRHHTVSPGETAWSICNDAGISLAELGEMNRHVVLDDLRPGDRLQLPVVLGLQHFSSDPVTLGATSSRAASSEDASSSSSSEAGEDAWLMISDPPTAASQAGSSSKWMLAPQGDDPSSGTTTSSSHHSSNGTGHISSLSNGHAASHSSSSSSSSEGGLRFSLGRLFSNDNSSSSWGVTSSGEEEADSQALVTSPAAAAVAHAVASGHAPKDGLVAVKIQYPDALGMMTSDLRNLRAVSAFLSKTEIKFDLVSAVDELQKQIHLEFDFMREARVMDTIAQHLSGWRGRVLVPQSVPGLVTQRLMVMSYMEGTPLMQLREKIEHLPQWQKDKAARRILSQLSEAYGRMILGEGLFQADGHPGNILVRKGGGIALLDYGQSKQLPQEERIAFANLILAMHGGKERAIDAALGDLGVVTSKDDPRLRTEMAYGMFDTRGTVNPFDPNSPIKQSAISYFPPDMFFVLRVVQLLRGLANGMGITDFSTASQWAPLASEALRADRYKQRQRQRHKQQRSAVQTLADIAAPLRLTV